MIISLSGMPGSGKSSVAKVLEKRLGMKRYYMGALRRKMALDCGIDIHELNRRGESDPESDREVDEFQAELGKNEDDFIIEGRTSFHFIPKSIKIFLDCDLSVGAKRIFEEKRGSDESYSSIKEAEEGLKKRIESDKKRYKKYYGIDCYERKNYDLVIDTTTISIEQAADRIIDYIKDHKGRKQ